MGKIERLHGSILLWLFVASGFAGLIYQSVWSHYLGLTLGHAAYAQALVLAIFMGGMALGAWLASRRSRRWTRLIVAYAVIEALIGVLGLLFHPLFKAYVEVSHASVLPALPDASLAHGYQWLTASLLIAPQCVLLGATFPLLSAGYMRLAPERAGPILGGLYFSNSVGAALGALASAFLILPVVGLPGSMTIAGVLNLLVAAGAWAFARHAARAAEPAPVRAPVEVDAGADPGSAPVSRSFPSLMLLAAAITGATSFVYEIGWVRLLNQALGTTVHSFELMLAAFILGLAFGGLWVRRRSARRMDSIAAAGYAQVLMGLAALLSVPIFNQSFRWVGWLMASLPRDDTGYALFNLGSAGIAMAVMFPAAFFAGMTLPLFTLALLQRGHGEASIGRIYAANTLGAILGVFATVFLLVPAIGVRLAITLAALADLALGLYLLRAISPGRATRGIAFAGLAGLIALGVGLHWGRPDAWAQVSGVFRTGAWRFDPSVSVPYLRDGQTATVSVIVAADGEVASIATNGKSDASLSTSLALPPTPDEETMLIAGALPLVYHPAPRRVAVIGWGSGLTTHTLLGSERPERVDTIEIETAMHAGASLFGERVARAYRDPRSHVEFDDARTYFATGHRRYDVIVSEPSNPWVSGVASLFTHEFYGFVRQHLEEDGVLVQWLQTYELSDALLGTMLAALLDQFTEVDVYLSNQRDLVLVAYRDRRHAPDWSAIAASPLREELTRVGLGSPDDFALRRIGREDTLRTLVTLAGAAPHSDFHPIVSLEAPRSRFKEDRADFILNLPDAGLPVQDVLGQREPVAADAALVPALSNRYWFSHRVAARMRAALLGDPDRSELRRHAPDVDGLLDELHEAIAASDGPQGTARLAHAIAAVSSYVVGLLPADDVAPLYESPAWLPDWQSRPPAIRDLLALYVAAARRDPASMLAAGEAMLEQERAGQSDFVREQALLVAMLGALGTGQPERAAALERSHGGNVAASRRFGPLRSWLLAWGDRQSGRGR